MRGRNQDASLAYRAWQPVLDRIFHDEAAAGIKILGCSLRRAAQQTDRSGTPGETAKITSCTSLRRMKASTA
jgi:hypothetical protein